MAVPHVKPDNPMGTASQRSRDPDALALVTDAVPVMISYVGADRRFVFVNSRYADWYGLDRGQIVGRPVEDIIGPDAYAAVRSHIDAVLSGWPLTYERRARSRMGERVIRADLVPDKDERGVVRGYVAVTADITDEHRAQQALRESEVLYRTLTEVSPQIVWMTDGRGQTVYLNQHWHDYTGLSADRSAEAIHPGDAPQVSQAWRQAVESGQPLEMELRLRRGSDGEYRWHLGRGVPLRDEQGRVDRWVGIIIDIHDRKQAEIALRQSEQRFTGFMQHLPGLAWIKDLDGRYIYANEAAARAFGVPIDKLYGRADAEIFPPDTARQFKDNDQKAVQSPAGVQTVETLEQADGLRHSVVSKFAVPGPDGRPAMIGGMAIDVTERLHAEQAVRRSESRFRALFEHSPVSLWEEDFSAVKAYLDQLRQSGVTDLAAFLASDPQAVRHCASLARIIDVNEATLSVYEAPSKEAFFGSLDRVFIDESLEVFAQELVALSQGQVSFEGEAVNLTLSGRRINVFIKLSIAPEALHSWDRVFVTIVDVTRRKRAEEQLRLLNEELERRVAERTAVAERQAEQLRAMSLELTQTEQRERRRLAQVLHDHLQQLLVAAKMQLGLVIERGGAGPDPRDARRLMDLLTESIGASRTLTVELSPPVLYDAGLVAGLRWLARRMKEQHGLEVVLEADSRAEPATEDLRVVLFLSIRELLFNIVKHAQTQQARVTMQGGAGQPIEVLVQDTGAGFDPAAIAHRSAGGGFGLFSIRERLRALGGDLRIESAPGEGARMSLWLPAQPAPASRPPAEPASPPPTAAPATPPLEPAAAQNGVLRVLLADDHHIVREGLAALISAQPGLQVVGQAADGAQAIAQAQRLRPDIIVMDVTMPGLSGIEATRRILSLLPRTRIIGLSMHDQDHMAAAMKQAGAAAYLTKGGPGHVLIDAIRAQSPA